MRKLINQQRQVNSESGQSLVEGALVIVILIMLLMGLADLGRAYFYYLALQSAAEEGVAYGAVHPTWHYPTNNANPNNVEYRTRYESDGGFLDWTSANVTVTAPDPTPGQVIAVSIDYNYELITPLISS